MKKLMLASALCAGVLPAQAFSQIVFQEGFESGANPFSFDSYNDYQEGASSHFRGEQVDVGGVMGRVWKNTFLDSQNDTYFGHRVTQKADWAITNRIHWAAYVKFGDDANSAEWATVDGNTNMGERPYELKFPDIYPSGDGWRDGHIIGKMRAGGNDSIGDFVVYTPNGQNHTVLDQGGEPLVSGRWYAIEFMVEDNGGNDTVKIWINNDDPNNPSYEHTGGDMFNSQLWRTGLRYDHGYRNHNVGRATDLYYDNITIANSFIGLALPDSSGGNGNGSGNGDGRRPAAPSGLQVDE